MFWELAGVSAVAVRRGGRVESVHAVAACAADVDGAIVLRIGTVQTPVFLRSSAKPFIAAAAVRVGVLERFGFGERELALMCASHNGEPAHVELVASMLERIGATVDDLGCGPHAPSYEPAAAALAARGGRPTPPPTKCERVSDDVFEGDKLAVDGCGIPVYATTLHKAAVSFARFATLRGLEDADAAALARVGAAMAAEPWYVAGTGRFDTDLI